MRPVCHALDSKFGNVRQQGENGELDGSIEGWRRCRRSWDVAAYGRRLAGGMQSNAAVSKIGGLPRREDAKTTWIVWRAAEDGEHSYVKQG